MAKKAKRHQPAPKKKQEGTTKEWATAHEHLKTATDNIFKQKCLKRYTSGERSDQLLSEIMKLK